MENVTPKILEWSDAGEPCCLATLVYADGSSPRPRGSQMAVAANGEFFGYLTGGCAEHAIAQEALSAIDAQKNKVMRFGVGSPYLDIQLPCGAGIDVYFQQRPDLGLLRELNHRLDAREPVALDTTIDSVGGELSIASVDAEAIDNGSFRRWFFPQRKLCIVGSGPIVSELSSLALAQDYLVEVLSPDSDTLEALSATRARTIFQRGAEQLSELTLDNYSAIVVLFHEHEREPDILRYALESEAYYIGALGSPVTHQARIRRLQESGSDESQLARIHGPVGLDIGAATPAEIALSILAESVACYRTTARPLLDYSGEALTVVLS